MLTLLVTQSCKAVNVYHQISLLISQSVICTLMTLRIYALYCSDRRILWFFGAAVVLVLGLAGVRAQKVEGALCLVDPGWNSIRSLDKSKYLIRYQGYVISGCLIRRQGTSFDNPIFRVPTLTGIVGIWLVLFVYDTVIFVLTAARTYQFWREGNIQLRRLNLFSLLFRDGAIYFTVMVLANLANILTFYLCGPFMRGGLSMFVGCISATMLCRLMLNLHSNADTGLYTRPDTTLTWRMRTTDVTEDFNEGESPK
ncbi:hypothetical protein Moror_15639 [Moniliophthora roreri MCA 2997]|uniref:Uncharacterized protein n=1 Tax=Moniliophthora roreri (strain MCA 2997) TaxID=1381753 RepID=V2W9A9_MONRO|nr:hypothetical protein Moror_15639 [Moniliophthora roreri MCA 2997]